MFQHLPPANLPGKVLMVFDKKDEFVLRAARNIPRLFSVAVPELNANHLLSFASVLFTQPALNALETRFPEE